MSEETGSQLSQSTSSSRDGLDPLTPAPDPSLSSSLHSLAFFISQPDHLTRSSFKNSFRAQSVSNSFLGCHFLLDPPLPPLPTPSVMVCTQ